VTRGHGELTGGVVLVSRCWSLLVVDEAGGRWWSWWSLMKLMVVDEADGRCLVVDEADGRWWSLTRGGPGWAVKYPPVINTRLNHGRPRIREDRYAVRKYWVFGMNLRLQIGRRPNVFGTNWFWLQRGTPFSHVELHAN